jgi:hypothetical protein
MVLPSLALAAVATVVLAVVGLAATVAAVAGEEEGLDVPPVVAEEDGLVVAVRVADGVAVALELLPPQATRPIERNSSTIAAT